MRLNKYVSCALTGALALGLGACSNEDGPKQTDNEVFSGDGYIAVEIDLPTRNANTRALNDQYADGTEDEYKVDDARIILFSGTGENDAVYQGCYSLTDLDKSDDVDNDAITTTYMKYAQIGKFELNGANLYGLVCLNQSRILTVSDGQYSYAGTALTPGTTKFSDMQKIITDVQLWRTSSTKDDYFFMTNAPMSPYPGGVDQPTDDTLQTLVQLNPQLYPTPDEAKAHPAGSIFVERAVAKATLSYANAQATDALAANELTIKEVTWAIGNTEETSYVNRNMTGFDTWYKLASDKLSPTNYRFVGAVKQGSTALQPTVNLYRTYWCNDPHYKTDKTAPVAPTKFYPSSKALYCNENTFDVAHQNYKNTTTGYLKVKFADKNGNDFTDALYVVNGDQTTIYSALAGPKAVVIAHLIQNDVVKNAFKNALKPGKTYTITDADIKLNWGGTGTTTTVTGISLTGGRDVSETGDFQSQPKLTTAEANALIEEVNALFQITKYKGGIAYYDIRFMHFASNDPAADLAPWTAPANNLTSNTTEAYGSSGTSTKRYLGRYGMVRNNWYDVEIEAIKKLGTPDVPDVNVDTPDDNVKSYISFKINVLSWAKRTQKFVLGD